MALDQAYFDSIQIDLVKRKYYNANKVEAVFADIRRQAQALMEENEELRRQLSERADPREQITEAVCSAQSVYRVLLEKANERADAIVAEAEEKRRAIEEEETRQRESAVQLVDQCLSRVREQQKAAMDSLNATWQDFLCGLYPEDESKAAAPAEEPVGQEDLDERVIAIARELFEIENLDQDKQ